MSLRKHRVAIGTETKREVWLLRTGFGIAPANKLVSLTWLLWALRSFRRFTLHYITSCVICIGYGFPFGQAAVAPVAARTGPCNTQGARIGTGRTYLGFAPQGRCSLVDAQSTRNGCCLVSLILLLYCN